jgi:hypothetical protein
MSAATLEGETRVRRRGAVILPNETVYDSSLSYSALGILTVLLARPEDAPKGYRTLMRPGVGQKAILSAFKELREGGYRYQFLRNKATSGRPVLVTDTYISDTPISLEMAKQWHFEATGHVAIVKGEKAAQAAEHEARAAGNEAAQAHAELESSKASLASLSDAHTSDAHSRVAQSKSFPGLEKNTQGKSSIGAPVENGDTALNLKECNGCHHYARAAALNDAGLCTRCAAAAESDREPQPEPEIGEGRLAIRDMLAARRSGRASLERAKGSRSAPALDGQRAHA